MLRVSFEALQLNSDYFGSDRGCLSFGRSELTRYPGSRVTSKVDPLAALGYSYVYFLPFSKISWVSLSICNSADTGTLITSLRLRPVVGETHPQQLLGLGDSSPARQDHTDTTRQVVRSRMLRVKLVHIMI